MEETTKIKKPSSVNMEDKMESVTRISFCGLGGTIVGLSLEKRLESMKITSALAAAARRKRGSIASSHRPAFPLSVTWGLSCMVFCSIIEVSRLTSPSTWIIKQIEATEGTHWNFSEPGSSKERTAAAISVSDHSIGGALAGAVFSFGRSMYSRNSVVKMHSQQRSSGLLPGLVLGLAAGTVQAAIEYGSKLLKTE
jgi:hypothetical protein